MLLYQYTRNLNIKQWTKKMALKGKLMLVTYNIFKFP